MNIKRRIFLIAPLFTVWAWFGFILLQQVQPVVIRIALMILFISFGAILVSSLDGFKVKH